MFFPVALVVLALATPAPANYNPDTDLPTPKIIKRHGYKAEGHEVITEDGYILTVHRIPNEIKNRLKTPILLQHGVLGSSAGWVINGHNRSLAYLMANDGYDVWLGNIRGNVYSRAHVTISPSEKRFWDFSWHEMGYYDVPAIIDYILNVTGHKSIYYVGHSMGTTMSYVLCSSRPQYNDKIKMLFSLAPVGFMSRAKTPLRYLAPFARNIELVAKWFGTGEFLPRNTLMHYLLKLSCENSIFEYKLCEDYLFIICGYDPVQFNMKLLPVILGHSPSGTSTKTLVHFAQEIQSGKFRQFDYGEKKNLQIYGYKDPPEYILSNITTPVSLHYADNDLLANVQDVEQLYHKLPNPTGMFRVNFSLFNHLDFLWSIDIYRLLFHKIESQIVNGPNNAILTSVQHIFNSKDYYPISNVDQNILSENEISSQIEGKESTGYMKNILETMQRKIQEVKGRTTTLKDTVINKIYDLKSYVGNKISYF